MRSRAAAHVEPVNAPGRMRIVVVDDHVFMRDLITARLNREETRYIVLASVASAAEAIQACTKFQPDLLILDINLPDQNGIDIVPTIRQISPDTNVLLCTAFPTEDRLMDAFRTGAKGFVEKTNTWDDFLGAVDRVGHGEQYFSSKSSGVKPFTRETLEQRKRRYVGVPLSPRETEIFRLIALGSTSKEIATKLFISPATVETHRTNLMSKLGVRNVAGLILYGFQHGLLEMPNLQ
jgi:DNA-binding NarL/FixJ family response regulator